MKSKVFTIYTSLIVVSLSLPLIFLGYFCGYSLMANFGYGVFGSGLVTLIIYIVEYFSEKKKNFELFYTSSIEMLNALGELSYFEITETTDAMLKFQLFKGMMRDEKVLDDFFLEMKKKVQKENPRFNPTLEEFDSVSSSQLSLFKKTLSAYLSFMKQDFHSLGLLFSDTFYLSPLTRKKERIFQKDIYEKIMNACKLINDKSGIFNSFVNGDPTRISYKLLIDNQISLNKLFFNKRIEEEKELVYATYQNDLFDLVEKYRCHFYNKKYVQTKHSPKYENLSQ